MISRLPSAWTPISAFYIIATIGGLASLLTNGHAAPIAPSDATCRDTIHESLGIGGSLENLFWYGEVFLTRNRE